MPAVSLQTMSAIGVWTAQTSTFVPAVLTSALFQLLVIIPETTTSSFSGVYIDCSVYQHLLSAYHHHYHHKTNARDSVCGTIITTVIVRVHLVYLMNVEQHCLHLLSPFIITHPKSQVESVKFDPLLQKN